MHTISSEAIKFSKLLRRNQQTIDGEVELLFIKCFWSEGKKLVSIKKQGINQPFVFFSVRYVFRNH